MSVKCGTLEKNNCNNVSMMQEKYKGRSCTQSWSKCKLIHSSKFNIRKKPVSMSFSASLESMGVTETGEASRLRNLNNWSNPPLHSK